MCYNINKGLEKLIYDKLERDTNDSILQPYGNDFWIVDVNNYRWLFQYTNDGELSYSQNFFNRFFNLFSLEFREYQPILKRWFESHFNLPVCEIARRNTNYDYFINGIMNNKYPWSIKDRYGFSYHTVKKYLRLKEENEYVFVKDFLVLS